MPGYPPQVLVTIGDVACTQTDVITPSGRIPIGQATWTFTDMSRTTRGIPTWAIVLAVLFVLFCLLGLFFLLVKEERTEGRVQVTVQGPGVLHVAHIPVMSPFAAADLSARVNHARALGFQAGM